MLMAIPGLTIDNLLIIFTMADRRVVVVRFVSVLACLKTNLPVVSSQ